MGPVSTRTMNAVNRRHGTSLQARHFISIYAVRMNLMGKNTFDSHVPIHTIKKMKTFGQVDKTAKRVVSIYWGKCGGADKSSGAKTNPFSSFIQFSSTAATIQD